MADYGQFETTRQGAQPAELYRFYHGNGSVAGTSAGGVASSESSAAQETFEQYADTDAMLAVWSVDVQDFTDATVTLDPTGGVSGGQAIKIFVPSGIKGGFGLGPNATRTFSGLEPNAVYRLQCQLKYDATFPDDSNYLSFLMHVEGSNFDWLSDPEHPAAAWPFTGQYALLDYDDNGIEWEIGTDGSGDAEFSFGWVHVVFGLVSLDHSIWIDNIRLTGPVEEEEPEPDPEAVPEPLLTLNYTTADVPITYEGEEYTPFIGVRSPFRSGSGERTASEIELRLPFDHPVSTLCMGNPGQGPVGVTVLRLDRQDLADGAAAIPLQGQVTRHRIEGRWCVITLGNVGTLLTRKLPRILTQRHCPHVLGGPFCQVDLAAFTHADLVVASVEGRLVAVTGAEAAGSGDDTYFQEGVLRTADGRSAFIEQQNGDVLTLKEAIAGLDESDIVTLVAGCDHQAVTCDTRFGNIAKFGGEVGMPDRNPFTGGGLI
jgi:uncharacterized phage protein (TIGR02218 family)